MAYNISVIVGSTRPGRMADAVVEWFKQETAAYKGELNFTFYDLKDWELPHYNEPRFPMEQDYEHEAVRRWARAIGESDGFIVITPEYNHGYPGALKDAFDYLFHEWEYKPIAFVAYGADGGYRAVEQLRNVVIRANMVPIRKGVNMPIFEAVQNGEFALAEKLHPVAQATFEQLEWWAEATATQRAKKPRKG